MNQTEAAKLLFQEILDTLELTEKTATGFYPVKCEVCHDTKKRGGFHQEPDGTIVYNCFRGKCNATTVWNPSEPFHRGIRRVLKAFHVEIPMEIRLSDPAIPPAAKRSLDSELYTEHTYHMMSLPTGAIALNPNVHIKHYTYLCARHMLGNEFETGTYYIGTVGYTANWLIVPLPWMSGLMGWQGINIDAKTNHGKYLYTVEKNHNEHLLYLPTGRIPDEPILVEGIFDAKSVPDGVGVLSSQVSKEQAYMLKDKNPILFPDKEGSRFVETALKYNWRMCLPKFVGKDANDALLELGRLELALRIHDSIIEPTERLPDLFRLWTMS